VFGQASARDLKRDGEEIVLWDCLRERRVSIRQGWIFEKWIWRAKRMKLKELEEGWAD